MAMTAGPVVLRMDSCSARTSEQIERVSERIRRVRARTRVLSGRISELTGPFLDADLGHLGELGDSAGPKHGQAFAREGRIEWLARLAQIHRSYCAACEEESRLHALLRRMQESVESISGSSDSPFGSLNPDSPSAL